MITVQKVLHTELLKMKSFLLFFAIGLLAFQKILCNEDTDFKMLMGLLNRHVIPERMHQQKMGKLSKQVLGFSWNNCGSSSDLASIDALVLTPDPLKIPGNVTVATSGSLKTGIASPVTVDLEIQKKVVFWITVPCIDNIGSCSYKDVCSMLSKFPCPPLFKAHDIPCSCPIKPDNYTLPATPIFVDPTGIPEWAESGDYKVKVTASYKGKQVFCLALEMSIA